MVKTWLSKFTFDETRTVRECFPESGYPFGKLRIVGVTTVTDNCLSLYTSPEYEWRSEYLGNGVWLVAAEANDDWSSWKVYERTVTVDSIQSAFTTC